MAVKFSNNFSTVLVSSISSSATVIELQSVSGLPTLAAGDHTYLTFDTDTNSPTIEIVKVTAINTTTNEVTVVRGQDNTSASAFAAGTAVELRMCAILLSEFLQEDGDGSNLTDVRAETVEVNVKNVSGGSLAKGTPVHQTGTSGAATFEVVAADASNASVMPAHFVLLETLADEAEGRGLLMGRISGVDTSSFSEGDTIYVAVGGGYTNVAPTGEGNLIQNLGTVTKVHASNGGGEVMGAGRSNATPNLNEGNIFLGNASNQAATASLSTSVSNLSHYNNANWDTAYGWGDHASAGYQAASTALTTSTTFGGDVSGTYNAIVVADDSHNHIISNVDGLQTALDGKVDLAGDTMTGDLGIGISPSFRLHAYHPTTNVVARFESGDSDVWIDLHDSDSGNYGALIGHNSSMLFRVADASVNDRMTLNNSGLLNTDAGYSVGGTTTIDSSRNATFGTITSSGQVKIDHNTFGAGLVLERQDSTNSSSIKFTNTSGTAGILYGRHTDNELVWRDGTTTNNWMVWNEGNQGSGSGLDADLLDGYHETSFVRTSTGVSSNLDSDYRAGMTGYSPSTSGTKPDAGYGQIINIVSSGASHNNSNNWITQLAFGTGQTTSWFRSKTNAGSWGAWRTIWNSANDGSGSGLDADLLDGYNSDSYLNKNASSYYQVNTWLQFNGGTSPYGLYFPSSGAGTHLYPNTAGTYGSFYIEGDRGGYWGIGAATSQGRVNAMWKHNVSGFYNETHGWHFYWDSGTLWVGKGTYGGTNAKVWDDSNDGSGSGLDADLLDGVQGSSYLRSDQSDTMTGNLTVDNGTSTTLSVKADDAGLALIRANGDNQGTGAIEVGQSNTYGGGISYNGDGSPSFVVGEASDAITFYRLDNGTRTEVFYYPYSSNNVVFNGEISSGAITSTGTSTFAGIRVNNSNTALSQGAGNSLRIQTNSGYVDVGPKNTSYTHFQTDRANFYFANPIHADGQIYNYNSGATDQPYWHAGNDGSGSGLDADLLDGLQASSFLRSDASDTMAGHLEVRYNGVTTTPGYTEGQVELYTSSNYVPALGFHRAGYSATTLYENDGQLYVNPWVTRAQAGLLLSTGNIGTYAWTSSNDGSGSGLDADLLDGQHASAFLTSTNDRVYITDTRGAQRAPSYYDDRYVQWDFQQNTDTLAGGDTWHVLQTVAPWSVFNSAHRQQQIAFTGTGGLKFRIASSDSAWAGWQTLWTSGNDGSGSGLDADLLDGLQAASFLRSDAADLFSGSYLEFQDNCVLRFGNGADYRIWHDAGAHTYFRNYAANTNTYFQGDDSAGTNHAFIYLRGDTTAPYVQLFGDGVEALRVRSGGATVYGDLNSPVINIDRQSNTASGINWYSGSYKAWATYMAPTGAGHGPWGNITAPSGSLVTSWALRNFIENASGYGWTFESGTSTGNPTVVAEIRSSDGAARFGGNVSAGDIASSGQITGDDVRVRAGDGEGYGFWNSAAGGSYRIYMSSTANSTYGGRVTGETTSDYNMYFKMQSGTNRGFVFRDDANNFFSINPETGIHSEGAYRDPRLWGPYITATNASSSDDQLLTRWRYADDDTYYLDLNQRVTSAQLRWSFSVHNNGSTWADRLVFKNANIGIGGVQDPDYTLDVNGSVRATTLYVGDGTDGYFYSDSAGRTAFRSGDFYIMNTVGNYYNYATTQYYGAGSGDSMLFRGNTLSGNDWSISAGGDFVATRVSCGYDPALDGSISCSNWFRSSGASGWYNGTYGGGMWMQDTTWVRTYGSKSFYVGGGNIATTGNVTAYYSDERLKDRTGVIENALSKVLSLEGFTYIENDLARELGYINTREQVGLSAQRVQAVLPQAVSLAPVDYKTTEDGEIVSKSGENYLTVDYSRLVPLLVESIKELKAEVDDLKAQLKEK